MFIGHNERIPRFTHAGVDCLEIIEIAPVTWPQVSHGHRERGRPGGAGVRRAGRILTYFFRSAASHGRPDNEQSWGEERAAHIHAPVCPLAADLMGLRVKAA